MVENITSVSLSRLMRHFLDKHGFSPTEVFRRGMAVMLAEIDESNYQTPLNLQRLKDSKEMIKKFEKDEKFQELLEKEESVIKIYSRLQSLKELVKDL